MCPPGVDQTTRSGPFWTLLAPKLRYRQDISKLFGSSFHRPGPVEFSNNGLSWHVFSKLARFTLSAPASAKTLPSNLFPQPQSLSSTIVRLPTEVLSIIMSELDIVDKIQLGLCCQLLWYIMLEQLQADYNKTAGAWARTPLICTSTWLEDFPEAMLDILPGMREKSLAWQERRKRKMSLRYDMAPAREWNWDAISDSHYANFQDSGLPVHCLVALELHSDCSGVPVAQLDFLKAQLSELSFASCRRADEEWALRNLNTSEFVNIRLAGDSSNQDGEDRQDVCALVDSQPAMTLDAFFILQVVWGPNPVYYKPIEVFLHHEERAPWAGHCFDIVPKSCFLPSDKWSDATAKMMARTQGILEQAK